MAAGGDSSLIGNNGGAVHTVKTKHLRKHPKNEENAQNNNHQHHHHHAKNEKYNKYSEEEIEEIVEQRADDIVPVDSIYSMTYPSINHIHGMDTGGVHGRGHGHGQGQGFKDELFPLSDIAGHIALVINVASEWGKTDLTYSHMKQMLEKYTEFGRKLVAANGTSKDQIGDNIDGNANGDGHGDSEELEPEKEIFILAFPTNDFRQETGTNEEIAEVVQKHLEDQYHNPNFILFHKSTLAHNPIYKMLKEHMPEADVKHNFYKYLIGRDGVPVGFYTKKQSLFDFESAIVEELESF